MPQYSIPWATNVVKAFVNDHARATNFLCRETGICTRDLVVSLSKNDGTWDKLKSLIKRIDICLNSTQIGTEDAYRMLSSLIKQANIGPTFKRIYLLTDYINQLRLRSGF